MPMAHILTPQNFVITTANIGTLQLYDVLRMIVLPGCLIMCRIDSKEIHEIANAIY